jgi:tetratricopeptide (TPR) repeat protein
MMTMWQGDLALANDRLAEAVRLSEAAEDELGIAMGHFSYGINFINQGRDREGYGHLVQAAERFDEWQSSWNTCTTLIHLANATLGLGEAGAARDWLQQAMPLAEKVGDPWQIAFCLNNFGEVARTRGDYAGARDYYRRSEALYREADAIGDHARLIHTLGYIALHDGDPAEAEQLFRESLAAFRELGNKRGMAECLAGLAAVGAATESWDRGVVLLSAAEAQMAVSEAAWWPADRVEIERTRSGLHETLGDIEFERLWAQGAALPLIEALDLAAESVAP